MSIKSSFISIVSIADKQTKKELEDLQQSYHELELWAKSQHSECIIKVHNGVNLLFYQASISKLIHLNLQMRWKLQTPKCKGNEMQQLST